MAESLCDPKYLRFRWWNVFELSLYWVIGSALVACYLWKTLKNEHLFRGRTWREWYESHLLLWLVFAGGLDGAKGMVERRKFWMYKDPRCPECMAKLPAGSSHDCPAAPEKWDWIPAQGWTPKLTGFPPLPSRPPRCPPPAS